MKNSRSLLHSITEHNRSLNPILLSHTVFVWMTLIGVILNLTGQFWLCTGTCTYTYTCQYMYIDSASEKVIQRADSWFCTSQNSSVVHKEQESLALAGTIAH